MEYVMFLNTKYECYNDLLKDIKNKKAILRVNLMNYSKSLDFLEDRKIKLALLFLVRIIPSLAVLILFSLYYKNNFLLLLIIPALIICLYIRINGMLCGFLFALALFLFSQRFNELLVLLLSLPLLGEIGKRAALRLTVDFISHQVLISEDDFVKAYKKGLILIERKDGIDCND